MSKRKRSLLLPAFLLLAPLAGAEPGIVSESAETIRYREVDGTETLLTKHPRRTIIGKNRAENRRRDNSRCSRGDT